MAVLPAPAAAPNPTTRDAMRLLKAECISCHNEEKKKGGLALSTRESALKGGDEGPVLRPGQPEASRLIKALASDADPHMPPKKQFNDAQIKLLRNWVKAGARWDAAALAEEETGPPVTLEPLPSSYRPVLALALTPDGRKLAMARGGGVEIRDVSQTNYPVLTHFEAHRDAVQSLAWSRDGRWLASGAFRRVALWNGASFALERELTNGLAGRVTALCFTTNDQIILADGVSGRSGHVRLVALPEARVTASWRAHADTIYSLDLSRDGSQIATAGGDKLIKVWDRGTRKELAQLEGHAGAVLGVAFNTNATQVVSGGADKQLKVWDIKTRERISTLGNHVAGITAVVWPGEGSAVVAVSEAGGAFTYKKLKAHSGEQSSGSGDERRFGETGEALLCVVATPDTKTIFAGGQDGTVRVWNGDGKLLAKLEPMPASNNAPLALQGRPVAVEKLRPTKTKTAAPSSRPKLATISSLAAEPAEVYLHVGGSSHGVLITARTPDGFEIDVTDVARYSAASTHGAVPFEVTPAGVVMARRPGSGLLTAAYKGQRIRVPVTVRNPAVTNGAARTVSFLRDVLPALSKAGCNAGACHAKPEGQNGFKLSVFSYDPRADYAEIVQEARGRRVFPAAPDQSLILQKPTTTVPHEGGQRFERGSETHRLLARWLREGMVYAATNEPVLERITVFPKERRYRKGASQRLLVQAHYSDGTVRDVTRLAAFAENDKEIAKVDEHGTIAIGSLTGQGVVVARYMGFVADSQILVPADRVLPASQYATLPRNNFIDELAFAQFQQLGLFPSDLCTDAEFLRRASLDAIGVLPAPEDVRSFLASSDEAANSGKQGKAPASSLSAKRRDLIPRLLDRPEFADYWANQWADLLRPNPDRVGVKSVFVLDQWLRESFRANKPYDQFVRDILLAEGTNHREGPAVVYRDRREPSELTTMFSQLFLGTRLECAKCHHHPNEKWSQDDFYQFAAFFGPVKQKGAGLSPPISAGTETFYFAAGGTVKHPVTGAVMPPRPLDGPPPPSSAGDPRRALAAWMTAPDNPFFARAAVNRVWAVFFGRGLVEPVDDFRISNPCVNSALLSALAADFARHGYDLKHLIRTILESRLYQLSSTPNESNLADTRHFSRAYRRRLPAEVLLDAVNDVTGVPDTFAGMPPGTRATQAWTYKIESKFMDAFSRPNPSSDPPCERDTHMSVVQSLHLMNSKALQSKLSHKEGRARQLADSSKSHDAIVTELYLATLSRPPTDEELKLATAAFTAEGASRQTATEDVFWALLNSAEFVFNH